MATAFSVVAIFSFAHCSDDSNAASDRLDAAESVSDASANDAAKIQTDGATNDAPLSTNVAFFDDFEAPAIDTVKWKALGFEGNQQPVTATATITTDQVHSGTRALRIQDGFLEAAVPSATFYGRVFTYFTAEPGTGHWVGWNGVGPGSGGGQKTEVRYGGHFGILEANYFGNDDEVISDPKGYCAPTCDNGVVMPIGKWSCVEFYYGKDEIRFWLNGTEVTTLHVTSWKNKSAPWSPAYDHVRIGFHNFQGDSSKPVYYDDVAFDSNRIGCAR